MRNCYTNGASQVAQPVKKEFVCNAGDWGLTPGLGRYPGKGNGYPCQYPCLENFMDRGAWQATVHGVSCKELHMIEQLTLSHICFYPPYNFYSFGNGVEGAIVDHESLRTNYSLTSLLKSLELLCTSLTF